ncbi:MAG: hypothetical protein ACN2B6_02310 [Rickettsiales bacterium]
MDPNKIAKLKAEQAAKRAGSGRGLSPQEKLDRAREAKGQRGLTMDQHKKEMAARRAVAADALARIDARNGNTPEAEASEPADTDVAATRVSIDAGGADASPDTQLVVEEPVEEEPKTSLSPIVDMDKELRDKMRFKLRNLKDGRVAMVISFTDDTLEKDVKAITEALESKSWGSRADENSRGYHPTRIADSEGEPLLVITSTKNTVSLIKELMAAKVQMALSSTFKTTDEFETLLELNEIHWKGRGGQQTGRG